MPAVRRPPGLTELHFPELLPHAAVLARASDEWQVGVEPGDALVLRGAGLGPVLEQLDGRHSTASLREEARAAGLSHRQVDHALAALLNAGLLRDRAALPAERPEVRVRLIGAGPIGAQLARLLAVEPLTGLYVFDDQPPEPRLYPSAGVLATRAQALCSALASTGTPATSLNHWSKPDGVTLDLTVIATETPEVDRVITDHLLRMDQPHLLVRSHRRGVCVGPLVIPGRTSCVRCADLARRDVDPCWPTVLNQLVRLVRPPSPHLSSWAASVAAMQTLAHVSGATTETSGATLEIDGPDFAMRWRSWPVHPGCGCGWSTATD